MRGTVRGAERAPLGPRAAHHFAGAGQRDVEQAPLFGFGRGRRGVADRHQALLEPGDEHDRPFEALGAVERDDLDRVAGRVGRLGLHRRVQPREEARWSCRPARWRRTRSARRMSSSRLARRSSVPSAAATISSRSATLDRTGVRRRARGAARRWRRGPRVGAGSPPSPRSAIGDAGVGQRFADRHRLRVGAHQHGDRRPVATRAAADARGAGDAARFFGLVGERRARRAARRSGECATSSALSRPSAPVGQHGVGDGEDLRRRPEVVGERDHLGRREARR